LALNKKPSLTPQEAGHLKHMNTVLKTCVNPDSQEPMPWPCRTSSFIPTNIPVIGGMILIRPTIYTDIFFQTVNQTLSVCLNIGNRNASSP
jgi:sideroflexin-5